MMTHGWNCQRTDCHVDMTSALMRSLIVRGTSLGFQSVGGVIENQAFADSASTISR